MTACFSTDRELRFGDCDISGTAYYPAYLNLLNGVVEEFWTHIGWPWHKVIRNEGWGTPTVHLSCDFVKPSSYGDRLTFQLCVSKVGNSSVRLEHKVFCGAEYRWSADQVLAASWLDNHTSMPWPSEVKAKLERLMSGPTDDHAPAHPPTGGPSQ